MDTQPWAEKLNAIIRDSYAGYVSAVRTKGMIRTAAEAAFDLGLSVGRSENHCPQPSAATVAAAQVHNETLTHKLEEAIFARDTYRKGMEIAQAALRYPRYGGTAGLLDRMAEVLEYAAKEGGSNSLIAPHARRAAERIREALEIKL